MTEYERGRRDAVRDVILYLVEQARSHEHYFDHEPEYYVLNNAARHIENFTALAPEGLGRQWDKDTP